MIIKKKKKEPAKTGEVKDCAPYAKKKKHLQSSVMIYPLERREWGLTGALLKGGFPGFVR